MVTSCLGFNYGGGSGADFALVFISVTGARGRSVWPVLVGVVEWLVLARCSQLVTTAEQ